MDTVGGHHVGRDPGEFLAVVAAVVGDAEAQVIPLAMGQDVVRKSLGGHSYRILVHAVGAHAHYAAKASRTEFEILVESILEGCRV